MYNKNMSKIFTRCLLWLFITYFVCRLFVFYPTDFFPNRTVRFQINNVEGYHQFLIGDNFIYTDKGVFINRDSLIKFKLNSQDILNYLFKKHNEGSSMNCEAVVSGFRGYWPVMFIPNIVEIQCD